NLNYTWEMSTWLSFFINLHHYTGITPKNDGLSVKCVLLTDKSAKNGILSVKLSEILVEQHYFFKDVFLRAKRNVVFNRGCHLRANLNNRHFARNG
ncbi:hypothetical protein, partial [Ligilactobacillus ruminis]|uniref:hypothetical protein n=1 Tax=Ligilactobacillus ruminis TaxID=1623 RepID=UPI00207A4904